MKICKTKNKDKILLWFHLENKNTKKLNKKKRKEKQIRKVIVTPHCAV